MRDAKNKYEYEIKGLMRNDDQVKNDLNKKRKSAMTVIQRNYDGSTEKKPLSDITSLSLSKSNERQHTYHQYYEN